MQFTIGSLISVVAFLLAFSQFLKPVTHLRINTGYIKFKHAQYFFLAGAIMVFIGAVIEHLPEIIHKPYVWLFGKQLFWEFSAGIFIFIPAMILLEQGLKPPKYSEKKSKVFLKECYQIIASGVEKDLKDLSYDIGFVIQKIFKSAIKCITFPKKYSKNLDYPFSLLDLFSDRNFCKSIICSNPCTLHKVIMAAKDFSQNHPNSEMIIGKQFISQLIFLLFFEQESILYREERNRGLGLFYGIKREIFNDFNFLTGIYQPLNIMRFSDKNLISHASIEKYLEILNSSLETYLNEGRDIKPQIFFGALCDIADIIGENVYRLPISCESNAYESSFYKNLSACLTGLIFLILTISKSSNDFKIDENTVIKKSKFDFLHDDKTLFGALAYGVNKIIEQFSRSEYGDESIRILLLEVWSSSHSESFRDFQFRLEILLKRQIIKNIVNQYFPAVTRALIYSFGLVEPHKAGIPLHRFLLKVLTKYFIKSYTKKPEIASKMLPKDTIFDVESKQLIRTVEYGIGRSRKEILSLK